MSRRALLLFLTSMLPVALLAACGGKALGSEATGKQGFKSVYDAHVVDISPSKRSRRPSFEGKTFAGKAFSHSSLRGSVTVVNFWGSWCAPCRLEETHLVDLSSRFEPRGVAFLGVNTRDTKADALSFLEEFHVGYPSLFDPYSKVAFRFHVGPLPVTFVLDKRGYVAATVVGPVTDARVLERILEREMAS